MYAGDMLLMADNQLDTQRLMVLRGAEATYLGLPFSRDKSGMVVFNDGHKSVSVQQVEIAQANEYNIAAACMRVHEAHLRTKGKRNLAMMKHRGIWKGCQDWFW